MHIWWQLNGASQRRDAHSRFTTAGMLLAAGKIFLRASFEKKQWMLPNKAVVRGGGYGLSLHLCICAVCAADHPSGGTNACSRSKCMCA